MFQEVAFDPSCMGSMEYYGLIKQHFGYDHGRYVSADVKSWAREAMQHVKDSTLQTVKQKSIKNYLNKLVKSKTVNEFHLANDRKSVVRDVWFDWYNTQMGIRPFSFSISESKDVDGIGVDDINDGCDRWRLSRSVSVDRNEKDIVDVLLPIIEISGSITIIDQYFRLSGNRTLVELFSSCAKCGVVSMAVVTSMESPNPAGIYVAEYKSMNTSGMAFSWIKAPDKFFHDRYFITDVGAIRSGHGFMPEAQKGIHADKANLNIISKDEAARTLHSVGALLASGQAEEMFRA